MLETTTLSDEEILRGLNANPQIKHRIASLLAAVEDGAGCCLAVYLTGNRQH